MIRVRRELETTVVYVHHTGKDDSREMRGSDALRANTDGAVKIVSTADKRTRTGTGEHGEYYTTEQKVIMNGGDPLLVDSIKGQTRGKQLTWWSNNDRLLVNGVENRPADTLFRKK